MQAEIFGASFAGGGNEVFAESDLIKLENSEEINISLTST